MANNTSTIKWVNTLNGRRYVVSVNGVDLPTLYRSLDEAVAAKRELMGVRS